MAFARNVELKAIDRQPAETRRRCLTTGATDQGVLEQRDTYFFAPFGRLKLREQPDRPAELIHYERDDSPEPRPSAYAVATVEDPVGVQRVLSAAFGVRGVVEKHRRLLIWNGVRIHLDEVTGLGSFVEIEAVAPEGSDLNTERALVQELRTTLDIRDGDLMAKGYATMLGI